MHRGQQPQRTLMVYWLAKPQQTEAHTRSSTVLVSLLVLSMLPQNLHHALEGKPEDSTAAAHSTTQQHTLQEVRTLFCL